MLPQIAPSVAISTGSGLTLSRVMPSFSRCAEKACSSPKCRSGCSVRRVITGAASTLAHIGDSLVIDDVIIVTGAQVREEV